jgi:hypothetical protein
MMDLFDISPALELRGKDGHTARDPEQKQDQQEEDLICQPKCGNGSLSQLTDHEDIDHIQASRNELLKCHRQRDHQHGAEKRFITQE